MEDEKKHNKILSNDRFIEKNGNKGTGNEEGKAMNI